LSLPSSDEVEIIGENPTWEECKPFLVIEEPPRQKRRKKRSYQGVVDDLPRRTRSSLEVVSTQPYEQLIIVEHPREPVGKLIVAKKGKSREITSSSNPGKTTSLLKQIDHLKEENSRLERQIRVLKGKF
jgi:hypothetical protein